MSIFYILNNILIYNNKFKLKFSDILFITYFKIISSVVYLKIINLFFSYKYSCFMNKERVFEN